MFDLLGVSAQALFGQLLIGLINGSFYALLSLGLAVIFGLLNIINFAHGAMYMMGAFSAWLLLERMGVGYWAALVLAPLAVGVLGATLEFTLLRRIYRLDHLFGLLLTFGIALIAEGLFSQGWGTAGQPYDIPELLRGARSLGFVTLPIYRAWVVAFSATLCLVLWLALEKTRLGAVLRAATENPQLVRAFGIRVPRLITLTYAGGVALAALAGVMAAPMYQVNPHMGSNMGMIVFAIVVIGGMGSIGGAIVSGFALGVVEGLTKVFYPQASSTVIFVLMAAVLLLRPTGLFGRQSVAARSAAAGKPRASLPLPRWAWGLLLAGALAAPFVGIYQGFLLKTLCLALFACAFNLLVGYAGLLSFGHAAFFGIGAYSAGYAMKAGCNPEVGLLVGLAAGATLGIGFGWLAIRRHGIYFAMVTLALAQMVYFFCVQAPFTGGEDGLRELPRGKLLGAVDLNDPLALYFLVLTVFCVGFVAIQRVIHSPFGQVLLAIRENEERAVSLGYPVQRCKLLIFVISAALAGLAGAVKVLIFQIATLADVHWSLSGEVVLMTLVGGLGSQIGPVLGAALLVAIATYFAPFGSWIGILEGAVFVACVLLLRGGLAGLGTTARELLVQRRAAAARPARPISTHMPLTVGAAELAPPRGASKT